jgi:hypothetical protein
MCPSPAGRRAHLRIALKAYIVATSISTELHFEAMLASYSPDDELASCDFRAASLPPAHCTISTHCRIALPSHEGERLLRQVMNYCSIRVPHGPIQPNDASPPWSRRVFTSKRYRFYLAAYPREPDIEISTSTPRSREQSQL